MESVHSIIAGLDFFKMLSRLDLCIAIALFVHHDCTMTLYYILSKIEPFDFFFFCFALITYLRILLFSILISKSELKKRRKDFIAPIEKVYIAHISHTHHNRRWCPFFELVKSIVNAKFWPILTNFGYFVAKLCTFWRRSDDFAFSSFFRFLTPLY